MKIGKLLVLSEQGTHSISTNLEKWGEQLPHNGPSYPNVQLL